MSIAEVCKETGLGRSTVYDQILRGTLRSVKVGRRRLVRRADLEKWVGQLDDHDLGA